MSPTRPPLFTPPRELIFRRALAAALRGCDSALDVGCGPASPLRAAGFRGRVVGVDLSWPTLRAARAADPHAVLVRADAATVGRLFRARSFDAVVALDVIEHLERGPALELIAALEGLARRRVVLFTPNGWVPQPPAPDNPHQAHRSGFTVDDLRALGYRVRGIHGLAWLCGPYAEVRWRPRALWRRASDLTAPIVWGIPRLAFALLGVKNVA